jgi:succinoglycan biosynthesis protein ExoL
MIIGYFGLIRCNRSIEILRRIADKGKGRFQVLIMGYPMNLHYNLDKLGKNPNIHYGGTYKYPDNLSAMYNRIDLTWGCYPHSSAKIGNHLWARTNRFYEACNYKTPIIANRINEDCKYVMKYKIGMCVDLEQIEKTVDRILAIDTKIISDWKKNLINLPKDLYVLSNEHEYLIKKIIGSHYNDSILCE